MLLPRNYGYGDSAHEPRLAQGEAGAGPAGVVRLAQPRPRACCRSEHGAHRVRHRRLSLAAWSRLPRPRAAPRPGSGQRPVRPAARPTPPDTVAVTATATPGHARYRIAFIAFLVGCTECSRASTGLAVESKSCAPATGAVQSSSPRSPPPRLPRPPRPRSLPRPPSPRPGVPFGAALILAAVVAIAPGPGHVSGGHRPRRPRARIRLPPRRGYRPWSGRRRGRLRVTRRRCLLPCPGRSLPLLFRPSSSPVLPPLPAALPSKAARSGAVEIGAVRIGAGA